MFRRSTDPRGGEEDRLDPALGTLRKVSQVLGRIFGVRLDVPAFSERDSRAREKRVKEFCVGLLENPVSHTWWQTVRGLGHLERTSIQGSLFLSRKALPSLPDPRQAERHAALMGSPAPEPSADFCDFVDREVDKLFKSGWDTRYTSSVYAHYPNTSSCLEYSSRKGGTRRWLTEQGHDWFVDTCLGESLLPTTYQARYSVVETGGKQRGVTVASAWSAVLGPLHRTLYDHLSQFEWLLRGEARGKKFKSFHRVKGEVFVSGDYEAATDNLSCEMAERILGRILSRCRNVPVSVQEYALRSLRATIRYPDGSVVHQRRGQLMGNFLSFPLLCLQNYLAFKYSVPRPVPLRINGDDIVFRCRPHEFDEWKKNVDVAGLTLSKGKTMVSRSVFSLNSAFFEAQSRRVREIPVIRGGSLMRTDNIPSGGAFDRFIRGWKGDGRREVGGLWLWSHRAAIQATGRSVGGCGIRADNSQLFTARLHQREAFFRGSKRSESIPEKRLPIVGTTALLDQLGGTFVAVRGIRTATQRCVREWQDQYRSAARAHVWLTWEPGGRIATDNLWSEARSSGFEGAWLAWRRTAKKVSRMLKGAVNIPLRSPVELPYRKAEWIPSYELNHRMSLYPGVGYRP